MNKYKKGVTNFEFIQMIWFDHLNCSLVTFKKIFLDFEIILIHKNIVHFPMISFSQLIVISFF